MPSFRSTARITLPVAATLLSVAALSRSAQAQVSYLALGDSYAYGYQTVSTTPPAGATPTFPFIPPSNPGDPPLAPGSNGFQGYVSQFATFLGLSSSNVLNLARPGETTTSYTTSTAGPEAPFNFNTNYLAGGFTQSQSQLFDSLFPNAAAGAGVKDVTIQLGGNDILGLLGSASFAALSPADQLTAITNAFGVVSTNYTSILTHIRAVLPNAQIYILGYPDPFEGLTSNPFTGPTAAAQLAAFQAETLFATQQSNTLFASLAALPTVNAKFVNLSTPFTGHEADWTLINFTDPGSGSADYHPNNAGYSQIALAVEATAVAPEPGTLALALAPLGGIVIGTIRRRRRAA